MNEIPRLRAADPLRARPAHVGEGVWSELRAAIASDVSPPGPVLVARRGRRWVWPGAALAAGVVALGGGVAVAARQATTDDRPLSQNGVNCLGTWAGASTHIDGSNPDYVGGPALSADPVADCAVYRKQAGKPPIHDPVASRWNTYVYVAPRGQGPADAVPIRPSTPLDAGELELTQSLPDYVDGAYSRCLDAEGAQRFAHEELQRLRLSAWKVVVRHPASVAPPEGPCADVFADVDLRIVSISPEQRRSVVRDGFLDGALDAVREGLATGIARRCVSLGEARRIADSVLAPLGHHWPTTAVPDPAARCTRVDLDVGGDVQVTIHGPAVARP